MEKDIYHLINESDKPVCVSILENRQLSEIVCYPLEVILMLINAKIHIMVDGNGECTVFPPDEEISIYDEFENQFGFRPSKITYDDATTKYFINEDQKMILIMKSTQTIEDMHFYPW